MLGNGDSRKLPSDQLSQEVLCLGAKQLAAQNDLNDVGSSTSKGPASQLSMVLQGPHCTQALSIIISQEALGLLCWL